MSRKKYFYSADEETNRNNAFQIVVAARDALSLVTKQQQPPTYEQSLRILFDCDPEVYEEIIESITAKHENDTVKLYKERAEAQSVERKKKVTIEDVIHEDIAKLRNERNSLKEKGFNVVSINREIGKLNNAIENLKPRSTSEDAILKLDTSTYIDRSGYLGNVLDQGNKFVDYQVSKNKFLRIRLLHPDKAEAITGADLIYEQYDVRTHTMRFVLLQYKTWQGGKLYFSSGNLKDQVLKLENTSCKSGYCKSGVKTKLDKYRFPYCSAFLRPTDSLRYNNSKMVSTGIHLPICNIVGEINDNVIGINKKEIKRNSVNHTVFEELFNLNLLGSRWLDIDEVEEFYKKKRILESDSSIRLYATEVLNSGLKDEDEESGPF